MRGLICFLLCLLVGCSSMVADSSAKPKAITHYDSDPDHLWNRLHAVLLTRQDRDGKMLGYDSLDPLVFPTTKRLLDGPSHAEAVKLLDRFLDKGHQLVRDPVKRAWMQRDLWAVFDWATHPYGNFYVAGEPIKIRTGPLQARLAKAIRKLALTKAEALALPDTYALAVKAKAFPTAYNPAKPNDPWLPTDLFDPAGSWVCVTGPKERSTPVASEHARVLAGRSVFLVFVRLPKGREATLTYLDTLNKFPKPWKVPPRNEVDEQGQSSSPELNPNLPQFPIGTQVALVRQMMVISDEGKPIATPLTESVQLRTYRKIAIRSSNYDEQGIVEMEMRRAELFAGKTGGLRTIQSDELVFPPLTFFRSWADPYETATDDPHHRSTPLIRMCSSCHFQHGIYSVHSYSQFMTTRKTVALGLFPTSFADERSRTIDWKTKLKDWKELKKLAEW